MRILYEDDWLIFVDKPPGLVVQRGYDENEEVLLETVGGYLAGKGERPYLVQRLDRGTSGVIFFTKRPEMNRKITRAFERKEIGKLYVALCEGALRVFQTVDAPIARIGAIKFGVRPEGRSAVTNVAPLDWGGKRSIVALQLLSGRTHQIRVHLASIGHPIVGDWLYGDRNASRPMLHAFQCTMRHPATGEPLRVAAPIPDDLAGEIVAAELRIPSNEDATRAVERRS